MTEHPAALGLASGSGLSRDTLESAGRKRDGNFLNTAKRLYKVFCKSTCTDLPATFF